MQTLSLSKEFITECKKKLLSLRSELLNRVRSNKQEFDFVDKLGGDEVDQMTAQLAEHSFLVAQDRMRTQLLEIDEALARIENGQYGFCEETEEHIEIERLIAIPWTRLSIEGAEIREATKRRG